MRRRHVLRWLGSFGLATVIGSSKTVEGYLQALAPTVNEPARDRALKVVRFLNTLMAAHFAKTGKYADLAGLRSSPVLPRFESSPYAGLLKAGRDVELAPQFTITVNIKAENAGYQLSAVEAGGKFKYLSDEKGVIRTVVSDDEGANAVTRPLDDGRHGNHVTRAFAALAGFFVPVLSASENPCGVCFTCQSVCLGCAPEIGGCCNWGTASCTWCCKRWGSCQCP